MHVEVDDFGKFNIVLVLRNLPRHYSLTDAYNINKLDHPGKELE